MYFSTADIEVAVWVPPLVAFGVSFFTSMGGVSGAFLLLPFQMSFLGYTHPSVSATNQLFNIVAIPSGVYRYWHEGRMVWPLTWIVVLGTLPGVFIGAIVRVNWLPDPRMFKLFAAGVLLYIGVKMIRDVLKQGNGNKSKNNSEKRFQKMMKTARPNTAQKGFSRGQSNATSTVTHFNLRRLGFTFYDESFDVSFPGIFFLSFIVGIIGGIYGIGGGAIIAPFFVTFFRLPVYIVAGAALMGTFVTSIAGVAFYQVIAPFYPHLSVAPDWLLGILFGIGGMAGMYLGARCQKFVPARAIKWLLAGIMVLTAGKYVLAFFGY
ncbi:MAG: sulfite exporter TauE/SafE family protein [Desulfobacteraceae bacterium]|nr:sulfite exporter TauE/SafE family protein [Desulfobacteraceae bacterium]